MGETTQAPMPVTAAEYRATALLLGAFLVTMVLALLLAQPFKAAGLDTVYEDSGNPVNAVAYIGLIIAFTFLILWIAKRGYKKVIQWIILASVAGVVLYLAIGILNGVFGVDYNLSGILGIAGGIALAIWLYVNPEWYVIDIAGLMIAATAATIFGVNLDPMPVIVLLTLLAVYDAIAVYKTKHMLSLADTVIDLRLPVLMVIPKHRRYSFRQETSEFKKASPENKGDREAMFMGLGDLVMPTILVVSAWVYGDAAGWGIWPSLAAGLGTIAGFGVLMSFVLKGNPQAGLPLLNGGAMLGFFIALFAVTGSLVFW